jgi:hypothetical protein
MGAAAGVCGIGAAPQNRAPRVNAHPGCCDESSRLENARREHVCERAFTFALGRRGHRIAPGHDGRRRGRLLGRDLAQRRRRRHADGHAVPLSGRRALRDPRLAQGQRSPAQPDDLRTGRLRRLHGPAHHRPPPLVSPAQSRSAAGEGPLRESERKGPALDPNRPHRPPPATESKRQIVGGALICVRLRCLPARHARA